MLKDLITNANLYNTLKNGPCRKCLIKIMCKPSNRCKKSITYSNLYNLIESPYAFIISMLIAIGISIFTGPLIPGIIYITLFILMPITTLKQLKEFYKDNGLATTILLFILLPLAMVHIFIYLIFLYTYIIIKRY